MAAYDEAKLKDDNVEIVVQINGKVKHKLVVPMDANKEVLEQMAMDDDKVKDKSTEKQFVKSLLYQVN